VHGAEGADGGEVFDRHVAGEGGGVGEDAAAADVGVVADVGGDHDETAGADRGHASPAFGSAGDGDVFADVVVVANLAAGGLAGVLQVLRRDADAGEGGDAVALAEGGVAVEDDVRDEGAAFAEDDVRADGAIGPDGAEVGICAPGKTMAVGWMFVLIARAPQFASGLSM
jgi:hypothetical protein